MELSRVYTPNVWLLWIILEIWVNFLARSIYIWMYSNVSFIVQQSWWYATKLISGDDSLFYAIRLCFGRRCPWDRVPLSVKALDQAKISRIFLHVLCKSSLSDEGEVSVKSSSQNLSGDIADTISQGKFAWSCFIHTWDSVWYLQYWMHSYILVQMQ